MAFWYTHLWQWRFIEIGCWRNSDKPIWPSRRVWRLCVWRLWGRWILFLNRTTLREWLCMLSRWYPSGTFFHLIDFVLVICYILLNIFLYLWRHVSKMSRYLSTLRCSLIGTLFSLPVWGARGRLTTGFLKARSNYFGVVLSRGCRGTSACRRPSSCPGRQWTNHFNFWFLNTVD